MGLAYEALERYQRAIDCYDKIWEIEINKTVKEDLKRARKKHREKKIIGKNKTKRN